MLRKSSAESDTFWNPALQTCLQVDGMYSFGSDWPTAPVASSTKATTAAARHRIVVYKRKQMTSKRLSQRCVGESDQGSGIDKISTRPAGCNQNAKGYDAGSA
jgi:hypothetical protein